MLVEQVESPLRLERIAREIQPLRGEIRAYLEEVLEGCERTLLEEVLEPERAARVAHTGRIIKVLLETMKKNMKGGSGKTRA